MHAVRADGVTNTADVIDTLGTVEHVEQVVGIHHPAVEYIERFPIVERIGLQNGVSRMALELESHWPYSLYQLTDEDFERFEV